MDLGPIEARFSAWDSAKGVTLLRSGKHEPAGFGRTPEPTMSTTMNGPSHAPPGSSYRAGVCVFVVGLATPLLIPLVLASELSSAWKGTLSGLLGLGIPEVLMVAGVALMGKSGFEHLKSRIGKWLSKFAPPDRVSPVRYRIGLVLLGVPVLVGWITPYVADLFSWNPTHRVVAALIGDLLLVAGLFTLGGEFWDKLRALFDHAARVHVETPVTTSRIARPG